MAVRAVTRSARIPSTSKAAQISAICSTALSLSTTSATGAPASSDPRARSGSSASAQRAAKPAGSAS